MRKSLALMLGVAIILALTAIASGAEQEKEQVPLVVVYLEDEAELEELVQAGVDIVDYDPVNEEVRIVMNEFEKTYFEDQDIDYDIFVEDLNVTVKTNEFGILSDVRRDYRSFEDYERELYHIADDYDFVDLHIYGESYEGYPLYALEISSTPGEKDGKPESVHMALHHAREWPSGELAMDLAWHLAENYGRDEQVDTIVDHVRTWIMPVTNPDGFIYSYEDEMMWRKTRSENADGTFGVDPNRNYSYLWGGDDGSSGNPSSNVYRGEEPFSEPEMEAIRDFYLDRHVITTISGHTFGRLVLYPWGHKPDLIPDSEMEIMAAEMSDWNGYADMPAMGLYPVNGDTMDWAYGTLRGIAFTYEYGQEFIPPFDGYSFPSVETDFMGSIEGREFTYSDSVEGTEGYVYDAGKGVDAADFPAEVEGNIALIERGENTFRQKAMNAQEAGAVGVIVYNNTSGHLDGTLGGPGVDIPVLGIERTDGWDIREELQAGNDVFVYFEEDAFRSGSYEETWEKNLPAFLFNIEQATEHAGVLSGKVTDKQTGKGLEAELEMEITYTAPLAGAWEGEFVEEKQTASIETDRHGAFAWHVLPSQQPEMDSDPYEITVQAENRYEEMFEIEMDAYGQEEELNVELQPVLELKGAVTDRESWNVGATIPFRFTTFDRHGVAKNMEDVTVTLYDGDKEVAFFEEGAGRSDVRQVGREGDYRLTLYTGQLGLSQTTYDMVIDFDTGQEAVAYSFQLQFGPAVKAIPDGDKASESKND